MFDTTANNTSLKNGSCIFIENSLQQELAWVACHHHVMELQLAVGIHVAVFRRFQQTWSSIDQTTYMYEVAYDDMLDGHLSALRDQNGAILQSSSGRVASKRRLQITLATEF